MLAYRNLLMQSRPIRDSSHSCVICWPPWSGRGFSLSSGTACNCSNNRSKSEWLEKYDIIFARVGVWRTGGRGGGWVRRGAAANRICCRLFILIQEQVKGGGNHEDYSKAMSVVTLAILGQIKFLCLTAKFPWKTKIAGWKYALMCTFSMVVQG